MRLEQPNKEATKQDADEAKASPGACDTRPFLRDTGKQGVGDRGGPQEKGLSSRGGTRTSAGNAEKTVLSGKVYDESDEVNRLMAIWDQLGGADREKVLETARKLLNAQGYA